MSCTRPIKAGFDEAGQIQFSMRKWSKEFVPMEFPCRKCIFCRLDQARQKAIRCLHHAQEFPDKNCFLTLTYSEENLESPRLIYRHWQNFMKKLRSEIGSHPDDRISVMVTGEYGDKGKRPHWHALLFNFIPDDKKIDRTTELGDRVYTSKFIDDLWGKGRTEFGDITLHSAGYVARYAAKKLVHGFDQSHDFHPIHRTSSRIPLGRPWIEKYWRQTFERGFIVLPNGEQAGIPRYYEDWFREQMPNHWMEYASTIKIEAQKKARASRENDDLIYLKNVDEQKKFWSPNPKTRNQIREVIQQRKHEGVLKGLKL